MNADPQIRTAPMTAREIRVRGRVQGVGFRPAVWRLAHELGLSGEVLNDADGVIIRVAGDERAVASLVTRLREAPPALARIEGIDSVPAASVPGPGFAIAATVGGTARTQVAPDAAICAACAGEILDPAARRHLYPFTNCTHCGPRFSIVTDIPYDRGATTMAGFALCARCRGEYDDPRDRRFHAEPIACPACGPRAMLVRLDDDRAPQPLEDVGAVGALLLEGAIVAVKGIGGYQLACDATNEEAVSRLRRAKMREAKPFALMARDMAVIGRYCRPGAAEARRLAGPDAPIVLMRATGSERLPDDVAPGLGTLGFMLATTPLHLVMLRDIHRPVVMTSGNLSGAPQIIDDEEARRRLAPVADWALIHDRAIATRIDDSVVRVMGAEARVLRYARGYAPASLPLPDGFAGAPDLLAMGGALKSAFCIVKDGAAVLSQHQGDLEDAATFQDYQHNLALYAGLFDHVPRALVVDMHPDYLSSTLARERGRQEELPVIEVQHHHAHIAACLAENGRPLEAPPVLGIVLDGLGWGEDGTVWGGEFLCADYVAAERVAAFRPVAMPGGAQAAREPWRNLYAHIVAAMGWEAFAARYGTLDMCADLAARPSALLDRAIRNGINSPPASSCGRLFDAVAAALGICRDRQAYEGEAAARLEAVAAEAWPVAEADAYPFAIETGDAGLRILDPQPMWRALLDDIARGTPPAAVAARFHAGLARAVAAMANGICEEHGPRIDTVALSGGCFHNEILFVEVVRRLEAKALRVLAHRIVPAGDGGLALGQAAIGAARLIAAKR